MRAKQASLQRLDNRLDIDNSAVENPQSWINSWSSLITTLSQDENTQARLMVSPLTNPDIGGMRWESQQPASS